MNLDELVSFADLKAKKIVTNRAQLGRLIKKGFPAGFMLTENSRRWFAADVAAWVEARAAVPGTKPSPNPKARRRAEVCADPAPDRGA